MPAIGLAIIAGALISDAFLTTDNFLNILQQSSELSVLVIAESLILIAGKFDLSLESTVGLRADAGRLADRQRHDLRRLRLRAQRLARDRRAVRDRRPDRRDQRLPGGPPAAQRLHRDAGDADPAARRHARHHQRQDALRPAAGVPLSRPRQVAGRAGLDLDRGHPLPSGRPVPALPPHRPRDLRDRRQCRGRARRRHPGRAHHLGRLRRRRPAGSAGRPDADRPHRLGGRRARART